MQKESKQGKVFFTSDTHYFHKNIAGPKVSKWSGGYRNFDDEYQMSRKIVHQINKVVGEDDILYHLGDWSFGGIQNIWNFRKQIKCKNIHLILGNHDHHIEGNKDLPNCWYDISTNMLYDEKVNNSCIVATKNFLFSSVQHIKEIEVGNYNFFLSHYAHRVWNKSHHGVIHLYGHSHASIDDNWGLSMDVGIDNAYKLYGEYRPFTMNEVIDMMNTKEIKAIDHHNKNTT